MQYEYTTQCNTTTTTFNTTSTTTTTTTTTECTEQKETLEEELTDVKGAMKALKQKAMAKEAQLRGRLEKSQVEKSKFEQKVVLMAKQHSKDKTTHEALVQLHKEHVAKHEEMVETSHQQDLTVAMLMEGLDTLTNSVLTETSPSNDGQDGDGQEGQEGDKGQEGQEGVVQWRHRWRGTIMGGAAFSSSSKTHASFSMWSDLDWQTNALDQEKGQHRIAQLAQALSQLLRNLAHFHHQYHTHVEEWHPHHPEEDGDASDPEDPDPIGTTGTTLDTKGGRRRVVNLSSVSFHPRKLERGTRRSLLKSGDMVKRRLKKPHKFGLHRNGGGGGHRVYQGEQHVPVRAQPTSPPPAVGMWESQSSTGTAAASGPTVLSGSSSFFAGSGGSAMQGGSTMGGGDSGSRDSFLLSPLEPGGQIAVTMGGQSGVGGEGGTSSCWG